ncbi:hypothetical protein [Neobacillus sp. D3-1R]|uniref:hypothetical protein n=1 Tax=Neobacillus sp. D3-1R TaxID=3445778 RepID=UPI003FA19617
MLLDRMQDLKLIKKVKTKLEDTVILEQFLKEKNKKIQKFKQIKEQNKELVHQTIQHFQVVDGVSTWEVNRKLKRLAKVGVTDEDLKKGKISIPLTIKKTNILATPQEMDRIEKMIDESEGFEWLRLHYFYNYKPKYMEKKVFGEVTRWIEITIK